MSSVSLGMVAGEALEGGCGCADVVLDLALVTIASLPNNVAHTSSGLALVASVNLNVVVGETVMVHCDGFDALIGTFSHRKIMVLALMRYCVIVVPVEHCLHLLRKKLATKKGYEKSHVMRGSPLQSSLITESEIKRSVGVHTAKLSC